MVQTYSNNNKIYSVDMMFAYINIYKPKSQKVYIKTLLHNLEHKGWSGGTPNKSDRYSPLDVINNPKKYKNEIERINKANLKYPIIVYNNYVIDGVHRLTKSMLTNKKTIKVYTFTSELMKKFLINSSGNWNKVDRMQTYDFIKLFYERF